ncbi:DJ-1/PfpI family protein [Streptomyces silvensis]|uniref:AraC family transcriptional regulator n=1 Tax=Streptomyces silvensis TaxID=1765722 RepID=A0A0W7WRV8_9ACTN|nr:DJ-1/PfpI family protein [Streptomyces silvensis]KUF13327.1 AraC family transcriptional regulator [Streptomyces silvensis]
MDRRGVLRSAAAVGAGGAAVTWGAGAAQARPGSRERAPGRPLRVHIVVFDGVEELDFAGPLEVFGAARTVGQQVETRLVTSGARGGCTGRFGTRLTGVGAWDPGSADVVVVPGGGFADRDGAGVWAEIARGRLTRALREAARPGLTMLGVCTGVVVLHAAGVVGDRPCTTHHRAKDHLRGQGADVRDARVVDDGNLVCAGGVSSGIDGALWLVDRALGPEPAGKVEALMEFERRGTVLRTRV